MCFAGFKVCFWLLQAVRLAVMGGFRADAQRLSRLFPDLVHEGVYTEGHHNAGDRSAFFFKRAFDLGTASSMIGVTIAFVANFSVLQFVSVLSIGNLIDYFGRSRKLAEGLVPVAGIAWILAVSAGMATLLLSLAVGVVASMVCLVKVDQVDFVTERILYNWTMSEQLSLLAFLSAFAGIHNTNKIQSLVEKRIAAKNSADDVELMARINMIRNLLGAQCIQFYGPVFGWFRVVALEISVGPQDWEALLFHSSEGNP